MSKKKKYVAGAYGQDKFEWIMTNTTGQLTGRVYDLNEETGAYGAHDADPLKNLLWCKVEFDTAEELAMYLLTWPGMTQY